MSRGAFEVLQVAFDGPRAGHSLYVVQILPGCIIGAADMETLRDLWGQLVSDTAFPDHDVQHVFTIGITPEQYKDAIKSGLSKN